MYTIKRTNNKGEETFNKNYDTRRKANNAMDRVQEGSSKMSIVRLYENDKMIEERYGLI